MSDNQSLLLITFLYAAEDRLDLLFRMGQVEVETL